MISGSLWVYQFCSRCCCSACRWYSSSISHQPILLTFFFTLISLCNNIKKQHLLYFIRLSKSSYPLLKEIDHTLLKKLSTTLSQFLKYLTFSSTSFCYCHIISVFDIAVGLKFRWAHKVLGWSMLLWKSIETAATVLVC